MAAKFRFISLPPDLFARTRFKPPAEKHSFLTTKPKDVAPAAAPELTPLPTPKPIPY